MKLIIKTIAFLAVSVAVLAGATPKAEEPKVLAVGGPGTVLYAKPRKTAKAVRLTAAPVIDGDLSDAVWQSLPRYSGFIRMGKEQLYADAQTVVKAGWDEKNLYLAVAGLENRTSLIRAKAKGPDSAPYTDDAIEVFLGPLKDAIANYYQFVANMAEGRYDGKGMDARWNGAWKCVSRLGTNGWTQEWSIPFETLGATVLQNGTMWRWNVARDRQAGNGEDMLSSIAAMSSGWHYPDEFDKLLFVDGVQDVAAEEKQFHADYVAETMVDLKKKLVTGGQDLDGARKILARTKATDTTATERTNIEKWMETSRGLLAKAAPDLNELNEARLGFRGLDRAMAEYSDKINQAGFISARQIPDGLRQGISKINNYWYLSGKEITVAIDAFTGIVCGIWNAERKPLIQWSYEGYMLETAKDCVKTDERVDEVVNVSQEKDGTLLFECRNPVMPGVNLRKRYSLKRIGNSERALSKEISVDGKPAEKTLISFVSRTCFDEEFRKPAYYHRVKSTGTAGDTRSVFWAKDITDPVMIYHHFFANAAANLCAINPQLGYGYGQYWLTANGKWVMPWGYEGSPTFLTKNGWDMSWFTTFISEKVQTGELRYHLFTGDRTVFHQEYRDLPERRRVMDEVKVSPLVNSIRYSLTYGPAEGPTDITNPQSQAAQGMSFLIRRLRSLEYGMTYSGAYGFQWFGDYPAGDNALIHTGTAKDSPTYPAIKWKEGIANGKKYFSRVLSGWYYSPMNIAFVSQMAQEHPDWLMKNRQGQNVVSWDPGLGVATFSPDFVNELIAGLCRQMDYYGFETMYLDYAIMGPFVDWSNGIVCQSDVSYDFLIRLAKEVHKRNGILFLNTLTFAAGVGDYEFWEGFDKYTSEGALWRDMADAMMMRRLYARPGTRTILLNWLGGDQFGDRKNYRDYSNVILAHLFKPTGCWHDPYDVHFKDPKTGKTDWAAAGAHSVAYFDTAFEYADTVWADVAVQPCWWQDFETDVEVNAFKQGPTHLLTVLRHGGATNDVALSADAVKMDLDPKKPTFVWEFNPRDPDQFPRRGGEQPPGWDKLFVKRACTVVPAGTIKGRITMQAERVEFLTRILAITQVPAVFCAMEGQETNLLLPAMLGGTIEQRGSKLAVNSPYPCELLVYSPSEMKNDKAYVDGKPVDGTRVEFGQATFIRISVPAGKSIVQLKPS